MNTIYSIRDSLTGLFVKSTDLRGGCDSILGTASPVELTFLSKQEAEVRLGKITNTLKRVDPAGCEAHWMKLKLDPKRFYIVEGTIKITKNLTKNSYFRIKDTNSGLYYLKKDKFHEIGKIYKSLDGMQSVITILTNTPKKNRNTKAQKLLFGNPKSFSIEIEYCELEYK